MPKCFLQKMKFLHIVVISSRSSTVHHVNTMTVMSCIVGNACRPAKSPVPEKNGVIMNLNYNLHEALQ